MPGGERSAWRWRGRKRNGCHEGDHFGNPARARKQHGITQQRRRRRANLGDGQPRRPQSAALESVENQTPVAIRRRSARRCGFRTGGTATRSGWLAGSATSGHRPIPRLLVPRHIVSAPAARFLLGRLCQRLQPLRVAGHRHPVSPSPSFLFPRAKAATGRPAMLSRPTAAAMTLAWKGHDAQLVRQVGHRKPKGRRQIYPQRQPAGRSAAERSTRILAAGSSHGGAIGRESIRSVAINQTALSFAWL